MAPTGSALTPQYRASRHLISCREVKAIIGNCGRNLATRAAVPPDWVKTTTAFAFTVAAAWQAASATAAGISLLRAGGC